MATTTYESLVANFRWQIPARYNMAVECCDRWAAREAQRVALLRYTPGEALAPTSYGDLKRRSDALAHALRERGIRTGDRLAILLPQSVETVVAHLAAYKLGAIAVPLAALFGSDALRYRLATSGAKGLITDAAGMARLRDIRPALSSLDAVLCTDGPGDGAEGLTQAVEHRSAPFDAPPSAPDDPALMIFTSGTTGQPKGALHGHRVLAGHVSGASFTHGTPPRVDDRFWTPSDWAWAGGLLNALLPALALGVPVVFGPFRPFEPEQALALMAEAGVTNAFLPPTALRMLRGAANPRGRLPLKLRTIGAAGESLGRDTFAWGREALGVSVDEFYGQTECNYVIGSSAALGISRAGATGRPLPGHRVAILDHRGQPVANGVSGEIAIARPDPTMFLGYWQDPEATAAKFVGDWMLTGDQAEQDGDGYIHFLGRSDDVITSAGYRIGPSEIEDCLASHPAVALAAVVGKPDALRTELVKAYVVLKPGIAGSAGLVTELQRFVRERLSAAEYPREIAFVDDVPLTTSGKVIRRGFRARARGEARFGQPPRIPRIV